MLDEPTIGLHTRDNHQLLNTLEKLRARGNSVVVVEHDEDTMERADFIIDLGPGAGVEGGDIVGRGTLKEILKKYWIQIMMVLFLKKNLLQLILTVMEESVNLNFLHV